MYFKLYKNGNIHIRYEPDYDNPEYTTFDDMVCMIANESEMNCSYISEPWCAGNDCMGYSITNAYNGKKYAVLSTSTEDFYKGKTIILYGVA